jgi:hypothetical protein
MMLLLSMAHLRLEVLSPEQGQLVSRTLHQTVSCCWMIKWGVVLLLLISAGELLLVCRQLNDKFYIGYVFLFEKLGYVLEV